MPIIEVKLLENRLDAEQKKELALKMVDTLCEVGGERFRDMTFCLVEELPEGTWAFAGKVY